MCMGPPEPRDPDEWFEWLDRAYAQGDSGLIGTKVPPPLKSLNSDRDSLRC